MSETRYEEWARLSDAAFASWPTGANKAYGEAIKELLEEREAWNAKAVSLADELSGVENERDEALSKLKGVTEYAEELRDERARLWPMAQVLPAVEADCDLLRAENEQLKGRLADPAA